MTAPRPDTEAVVLVRGRADAVDLAALTAVLHALARRRGAAGASGGAPAGPPRATWDRPSRASRHRSASWRP
ncbi:acyl-CoA carboxylase epsilon subunit [Streptomyces sp. NPDC006733]|uniref:acyl-CoA carboxylase epsilon subunit n=1 Tax=Streptomyces sp. NPDC006733 TaxID=3155460 RepID=UPI0033C8570D